MSAVARQDVSFASAGSRCGAWLYLPHGPGPHPAVVLAHGLGGERRHRLDVYAERFAGAGLAALAFDYRHFGDSDGEPRRLVSIRRQLADWEAAVAFARRHPKLDSGRIALWGTSLSGGHVQVIAARDRRVGAAIAQVPFASGAATAKAVGLRQAIRLGVAADRDLARAALGREAYRVPIFGPPGSLAAMSAPGAEESIRRNLLAPGEPIETMPARIFSFLPYYRAGRRARRIACPILYQVALNDRVNPRGPALRAAARAPHAELRCYSIDHFDVYAGEPFERAVADQIDFLRRHLGVRLEERARGRESQPPPAAPAAPGDGAAPDRDGAAQVEAAILGPAGRSDAALRRLILERAALLAGRDAPPPAEPPESLIVLIDKIVRHAYRVTDEDIAAARAAGHGEDELFDVIVAAALGAGLVRRERGLAVIAAWEAAR